MGKRHIGITFIFSTKGWVLTNVYLWRIHNTGMRLNVEPPLVCLHGVVQTIQLILYDFLHSTLSPKGSRFGHEPSDGKY